MALSLKQKQMLQELEKNFCNVTDACKLVGISRRTHYKYLEANSQYFTEYEQLQESLLDRAENILHKQLEESPQLLTFFLKTRGKKRGYSEKVEVEHSGNISNITLEVVKSES